MKAHSQPLHDLIEQLQTNTERGLSAHEVQERLARYGLNQLARPTTPSLLRIIFGQMRDPLIFLLLGAAVLVAWLGNITDAAVITAVLLFNACMGAFQERRAHKILDSLAHYTTTTMVVLRDGAEQLSEVTQLVPGDIVLLHEGDYIPADMRLIASQRLAVDEAVLTGESAPISKRPGTISALTPLYAQDNMLFQGTAVVRGSGTALVIATGVRTQLGKLQAWAQEEVVSDTPLKQELNRVSYWILILVILLCGVLLVVGVATGKPLVDVIATLTALFICVVPEGLPLILTLVLVTGARRMARKHILIKQLPAIDALGRVQLLMLDKTGTLTRNELMVHKVALADTILTVSGSGYYPPGTVTQAGGVPVAAAYMPILNRIAHAAYLLNKTFIHYNEATKLFSIEGDPLEAALGVFARKVDDAIAQHVADYVLLYEIPFSPEYKYHAAFFEHAGQCIAFVIGAPEVIEQRSVQSRPHNTSAAPLLAEGLRVVAVARKAMPLVRDMKGVNVAESFFMEHIAHDLELLGYLGIQDTLRTEVIPVVHEARAAGLRLVMVTGDHPATARYIAYRAGIMTQDHELIDASTITSLAQFEQLLTKTGMQTTVYARVTPDYKLALVRFYRARGISVAMTGDGVNDVPSIAAADVGIAMGHIGTEVAKQAADVVLLDDSFVNVIEAVKEGRHIFYSLRRVMVYFFATNLGEVLVICFAFILRQPIPITAAQILWLNVVTDGALDMALAMEPHEKDVLRQHYAGRHGTLIDRRQIAMIVYMALPMGIGALAVFSWYYQHESIAKASTMTFMTMAMYQWFNAWNCRSEYRSMGDIGLFTNRWLLLATAGIAVLLGSVVMMPLFQTIFGTVALSPADWQVIVIVTLPVLVIEELRKWIIRRRMCVAAALSPACRKKRSSH